MEAERWKTGLCPNWSLPKARTEWRSLRERKAMSGEGSQRSRSEGRRKHHSQGNSRRDGHSSPTVGCFQGRQRCSLEQDWRRVGIMLRTRQSC